MNTTEQELHDQPLPGGSCIVKGLRANVIQLQHRTFVLGNSVTQKEGTKLHKKQKKTRALMHRRLILLQQLTRVANELKRIDSRLREIRK